MLDTVWTQLFQNTLKAIQIIRFPHCRTMSDQMNHKTNLFRLIFPFIFHAKIQDHNGQNERR